MDSLLGLILLMLFGMGQATPTYKPLQRIKYSDQFCSDTYSGRQLYVGEAFTRLGQCIRVQCLGTLQLWEDSCNTPLGLKGNCVVIPRTETNLEYPACCPLHECKTYESSSRGEMLQTNTYDHNGNLRKTSVSQEIVIRHFLSHSSQGAKVEVEHV